MSTEESVDPRLVEQAQQQIRTLVAETQALARQEVAPDLFFTEFLQRVITALAAVGGAVWNVTENAGFELQKELNINETGLPTAPEDQLRQHATLLTRAAESAEGLLVTPRYSDEEGRAANPTDCLLVLAPVKMPDRTGAIVEIFQRPDSSIRTQRGYLRFVAQMCEIAADYLKQRMWRQWAERQALWQRLEKFTRGVHASLDPRITAYTIANEGRLLIDCDRVSVAIRRGNRMKIVAISGQDIFDARALTVRLLGELATTVAAAGDAVWYKGDTRDFPPQIEEAVQAYVDESHSKLVAIIPLRRPHVVDKDDVTAEDTPPPEPLAVLVVEQIEDSVLPEGSAQRTALVAEHAGEALANAQEHDQLFLMPLWRAIGNSRWVLSARTLPKTLSIAGAILLTLLALFIVPYPFRVSSEGKLQPMNRRDVFAPFDATIDKIDVRHGQKVTQGATLLVLRSTNLEGEFLDLEGQFNANREALMAVEAARYQIEKDRNARPDDRNRLEAQAAELRAKRDAFEKQLEVLKQKKALLNVASPIDGVITTWDVEHLLRERPVRQGQVLLTVADTKSDWELELHMPEHRLGHLVRAQEAARKEKRTDELPVTFRLATQPGVDHRGVTKDVHRSAEVRGEEGNIVLVKVKILDSPESLGELRPGTDVVGKVDCGWSSIGDSVFHDVIEFLQMKVLFKL